MGYSPSEKAGVEVVSGRAQVQTAEMGEVIRSMEERELKCVRVHGLRHIVQSVPPRGGVSSSAILRPRAWSATHKPICPRTGA